MDVFTHHLLEYKKGLRTLVLHTTEVSNRNAIKKTGKGDDRLKQCERHHKRKRNSSTTNLEKVGCKLKSISRLQTEAIRVIG